MLFVTGDTHADFHRFNRKRFPIQKQLTRNDIVIICGDFGGVWADTDEERYWLDWLSKKRFTICFVDGNHESFDRLNNEFDVVDFHGGKAHKIRDNVYHLMRGHIFDFEGKKFFAFGGASSHDIQDGILDRNDFESDKDFKKTIKAYWFWHKMFRINHVSWWKEELPSQEEMDFGLKTLEEHGYEVDYVITHSLPQEINSLLGFRDPDTITLYFNGLLRNGLKFKQWFAGHLHINERVLGKFNILYGDIVRIL